MMTEKKIDVPQPAYLALSQMAQVIHMFKRYRQTHTLAFGVTVPQFNTLVWLERYGGLNPSRIADLLFSDRPTTTVILNNLERQGWIERSKDKANRKFINIKITESGAAKLRELREAEASQSGDFEPLACYSEDEITHLEGLLDRLIVHFRKLPVIEAPKNE